MHGCGHCQLRSQTDRYMCVTENFYGVNQQGRTTPHTADNKLPKFAKRNVVRRLLTARNAYRVGLKINHQKSNAKGIDRCELSDFANRSAMHHQALYMCIHSLTNRIRFRLQLEHLVIRNEIFRVNGVAYNSLVTFQHFADFAIGLILQKSVFSGLKRIQF